MPLPNGLSLGLWIHFIRPQALLVPGLLLMPESYVLYYGYEDKLIIQTHGPQDWTWKQEDKKRAHISQLPVN